MASYFRDSGCLEKAGDLDVKMHDVAYVGENVDSQKRVSSQCEEVIIDTDLFDLKDVCPNATSSFSRYVRGARAVRYMTPPFVSPSFAAKPTRFNLPVGPF